MPNPRNDEPLRPPILHRSNCVGCSVALRQGPGGNVSADRTRCMSCYNRRRNTSIRNDGRKKSKKTKRRRSKKLRSKSTKRKSTKRKSTKRKSSRRRRSRK